MDNNVFFYCSDSKLREEIIKEFFSFKKSIKFSDILANIMDKFGCNIEVRETDTGKHIYVGLTNKVSNVG